MKKIGMTYVLLIMAVIYLPIMLLVFLSFSDGLAYYVQLFTTAEYMRAIGNTLLIALVSAAIATIIATMAATGMLYLSKKSRAVTMAVNQLPIINADIVTSFALVLLFVSIGLGNFGLLKLLLAHILIALPFCLLTVLPKMRQLDANLIDAALDLGATPFKAFVSVIVPQMVPAMLQAFLLGFTLSLDDFVITQYNNSGVPTVATVVYGAISRRDIPDAFKALTTIIFLVILVVLVVMNFNAARQRQGRKISRKVLAIAVAAVLLLTGAGIIPVIVTNLTPRSSVLKIYNWEDYIQPELLAEFEAAYRQIDPKFRLEYHTFSDNEELYSKINAQHADYDLVFPSEYMVEKMASQGLLKPLDMTKIKHQIVDPESGEDGLDQNIWARTAAYTTVYDQNHQAVANQVWGIPYMLGTVGIMYDTTTIELLDVMSVEDFESKLEQYGFGVLFGAGGTDVFSGHITMKKSARDSIGIAMLYAEQNRENVLDSAYLQTTLDDETFDNTLLEAILNMDGDYKIDRARQVLLDQIRVMHPVYENDNGKKSFVNPNNHDFAYGLFWSCDAGLAINEAYENNDAADNLKFYTPTGSNLWTDNFALPVYGKNTDAAYAFINFMLDPENAARNIDYVGSQMVVTGSAIDDLIAGYLEDAEDDTDMFDYWTSYTCAVFPNVNPDNITYAAIMHNFDHAKEKSVNNLMLEVQNKAAQLTENESGGVNWFLVGIGVLVVVGLGVWLVYYCMHRRPKTA